MYDIMSDFQPQMFYLACFFLIFAEFSFVIETKSLRL